MQLSDLPDGPALNTEASDGSNWKLLIGAVAVLALLALASSQKSGADEGGPEPQQQGKQAQQEPEVQIQETPLIEG